MVQITTRDLNEMSLCFHLSPPMDNNPDRKIYHLNFGSLLFSGSFIASYYLNSKTVLPGLSSS